MPGSGCRRGFTFVEILATLALVSIVLPAVMSGISLCLSTASLARQKAEASALGQAKLMELVAQGQLQQAELSGDFGEAWPDYRWTLAVSEFDGATLLNVELTVSWRQHDKDRNLTLTTLAYASATAGTTVTSTSGGQP